MLRNRVIFIFCYIFVLSGPGLYAMEDQNPEEIWGISPTRKEQEAPVDTLELLKENLQEVYKDIKCLEVEMEKQVERGNNNLMWYLINWHQLRAIKKDIKKG